MHREKISKLVVLAHCCAKPRFLSRSATRGLAVLSKGSPQRLIELTRSAQASSMTPPWMRVRVVDPETLEEAPAGRPGLIAVLDLANLGSAVHLLTEDLGVGEGEGFRLLGRAAGAELRGCSLAAEELAARV